LQVPFFHRLTVEPASAEPMIFGVVFELGDAGLLDVMLGGLGGVLSTV
jgi:hypothetical protein